MVPLRSNPTFPKTIEFDGLSTETLRYGRHSQWVLELFRGRTQRPGEPHTRPMASTIGTMRALLQEGGAAPSAEGGDDTLPLYKVSCAECEALNHPAVVASDWIGFIALGFSAFILIFKLQGFRGPNQDDKYYFGLVPQPSHSAQRGMSTCLSGYVARGGAGGGRGRGFRRPHSVPLRCKQCCS